MMNASRQKSIGHPRLTELLKCPSLIFRQRVCGDIRTYGGFFDCDDLRQAELFVDGLGSGFGNSRHASAVHRTPHAGRLPLDDRPVCGTRLKVGPPLKRQTAWCTGAAIGRTRRVRVGLELALIR